MTVLLISPVPGFQKELIDIINIFMPDIRPVSEGADLDIRISDRMEGGRRLCEAQLSGALHGVHEIAEWPSVDPVVEKRLHKRQQKLALYYALVQASGLHPSWGSLTGIRPTRLVMEAMSEGLSLHQATERTRGMFDLRADKAGLLGEVIRAQQSLSPALENEISCYIGIPFCVSRCRYCSFLSREVGDGSILPAYVSALEHEIAATARLISGQGLSVRSVYVGGGTPTALPASLLARVLKSASGLILGAREVTVEAGRPDTITKEKLKIIMDSGGSRISVNPQSMHDRTLAAIGRGHTARQTEEAFLMARQAGFKHINMDLIAGLPGENLPMFSETLNRVVAMGPEALTVHTLSLKRSSDMYRFGDALPEGDEVETMVDEARGRCLDDGYEPYYLYRQKHMAGNMENVGYAKPGSACLYNIDMMEDMTTVLAMGAGAVSKRVWPGRKRILRAPNVKDIQHYISRVDEMIIRKDALMQGVGKGVRPASVYGWETNILPLELEDKT